MVNDSKWAVIVLKPQPKLAFAEKEEEANGLLKELKKFYFMTTDAQEFEGYVAEVKSSDHAYGDGYDIGDIPVN